jgi:hypothetical protein
MTEPNDPQNGDRETAQFEQRARALLEESVTHVDARVRSRLNQARHAALAQLPESHARQWTRRAALPVGLATAAAVTLVAVLSWHQRPVPVAPDDEAEVELLADGEAFELLEDDGAFYEWALSEEAGG